MLEYIYRDVSQAVRYLPWGLAIGVPAACGVVWLVNRRRKRKRQGPLPWPPVVIFGVYLAVLAVITFLSRESGDRNGVDIKLFSTWGINDRNNAYVIENVLLFIPYGFLCCWNFRLSGRFFKCAALGAAASFVIESLQLITGRGFFQIDDILTNILGTVVGWALFRAMRALFS